MPLKPHPTDPDKMVYASRWYDIPQLQGVTTAQPAPVQEFGLTLERFNALEVEITTLQAEWQSALKEVERLKAAHLARERNFCERCGKRTADLNTIHTCTPPQEKNR